jgi:hypothetical protein
MLIDNWSITKVISLRQWRLIRQPITKVINHKEALNNDGW